METESFLNNLDYIVIGVVLLSGVLALIRGFTRELFSLVAWVGAYFAGAYFYEPLVPWVKRTASVSNEKTAEWLAMAVMFAIVLVLLSIVGHVVCGFVKGRLLTSIDRILGFVYGLARGTLVVCLIYLGAVMIFWPSVNEADAEQVEPDSKAAPELLLKAKTRHMLAGGAKLLMTLAPEEVIDQQIKDLEKQKEEAAHDAQEVVNGAVETMSDDSGDEAKGPIDIDKLFDTEKKP